MIQETLSYPAAEFISSLRNATGKKILVIGDLMLDRYLWGKVERISPEAPVPIVEVEKEENRLGGAANVALNLLNLGATPILCGVIGKDPEGELFLDEARQSGLSLQGILRLEDRRTTAKIRVLGNHHQMLRVDKEVRHNLTEEQSNAFLEVIVAILPECHAIIFEDYDKGLLSRPLIATIMNLAAGKNIQTFIDPKFKNFFHYQNCTVFKPNFKELKEGLHIEVNKDDVDGLKKAVARLKEKMPHQWSLLTLSENGMMLSGPAHEIWHIPAHTRQIADVSGAGDTVIAVLTLGIVCGLSMPASTALANLAGGRVCEFPGVVPIKLDDLTAELSRLGGLNLSRI